MNYGNLPRYIVNNMAVAQKIGDKGLPDFVSKLTDSLGGGLKAIFLFFNPTWPSTWRIIPVDASGQSPWWLFSSPKDRVVGPLPNGLNGF